MHYYFGPPMHLLSGVDKFKSTGNALQKCPLRPLWFLIPRPSHAADLGHCREPVIQFGDITVCFPWIAPGPVNTEALAACYILSRLIDLIIGTWRIRDDRSLRFLRGGWSINFLSRHLGKRRSGKNRTKPHAQGKPVKISPFQLSPLYRW